MAVCQLSKDSEEFREYPLLVEWIARVAENEKEVQSRINEMWAGLKKLPAEIPTK